LCPPGCTPLIPGATGAATGVGAGAGTGAEGTEFLFAMDEKSFPFGRPITAAAGGATGAGCVGAGAIAGAGPVTDAA